MPYHNPFDPSPAYMDWLERQVDPQYSPQQAPVTRRADPRSQLECSAAVPRWLAPPLRERPSR